MPCCCQRRYHQVGVGGFTFPMVPCFPSPLAFTGPGRTLAPASNHSFCLLQCARCHWLVFFSFFAAASNGDIWISTWRPHMWLPICATAVSSLAHLIITVSSPVPTGCLMTWYTLRVITRPGYVPFFFFSPFEYKPSNTCISKQRSKLHQMVNTINQEVAEAKQRDVCWANSLFFLFFSGLQVPHG